MAQSPSAPVRLKKELTLYDTFSVSTGAMFSSGFFLLPGLAAAYCGPSVVLAYLLAGLLITPAMFSIAELSTAMPKAGGTYYFLDRSLGPMLGTVGGLGTYLALVLKTAFALIGIGAYAAIFVELPIQMVAVVLTLGFMVLNIFGAKETTGLQRVLVTVLVLVLIFFIVQGLANIFSWGIGDVVEKQFTPFMPFGTEGLFYTVGLVFVSYLGLTKVTSVAEEVKNPERNIPLGMMLALWVTTFIYVVGVFVMVSVLEPEALHSDMTPVATAGQVFFGWLPKPGGLILVVIAAIAAFVSTGNAGLLSASRYPFAMARDRLLPDVFARLGRFQTPVPAIVATSALMILFILVLDVEGIAKLASGFQLFIFLLINLAVIVMRESRIESYDPGYRTPLYPYMQICGILFSIGLIAYMGVFALLFIAVVTVLCLLWYFYYARSRCIRGGAIYHWFALLGKNRYEGLESELRSILKEKGLREGDPFDDVIARAKVVDIEEEGATFQEVVEQVSKILEDGLPATAEELAAGFMQGTQIGATPVSHGISLPHLRLVDIDQPEIVLARVFHGVKVDVVDVHGAHAPDDTIYALIFLISPEKDPKQHLRILAQIAEQVDSDGFLQRWLAAKNEPELKQLLLRDERFLDLRIQRGTPSEALIGRTLRELQMPEGTLVALIWRDGQTFVPRGSTQVREDDHLTIIGDPVIVEQMRQQYEGER